MMKRTLSVLFLTFVVCNVSTRAQDEQKIVYGILLDNSASMLYQANNVKNLAKEVVIQSQKKGPVSLFAFRNKVDVAEFKTLISSSQDQAKLEEKIDSLVVAIGKTELY